MKWYLISFLVLVGMCVGCANPRTVNRANLLKLQTGMTKSQVIDTMGKPYNSEYNNEREIWYYDAGLQWTNRGPRTTTPLLFIDGKKEPMMQNRKTAFIQYA